MYGATVHGMAPWARQKARRRYAQALRRPWPGRCLTTFLALEGTDPAATAVRAQLKTWFEVWARHPEIRNQVRRAWPRIYFRMQRLEANKRWQARRGPLASMILLLWEVGWDSRGPDTWIDRNGDYWKFGTEEQGGDYTEIVEAFLDDLQDQLWEQAAQHHNGAGLERGADVKDLKHHLRMLAKKERYGYYGALLTAACAGTWTHRRKHDTFGGAEARCECGEAEDDVHRIWGACTAREDSEAVRRSSGLTRRALEGCETNPAFWLRGITPKSWTVPPRCDTLPAEHLVGACNSERRLRADEGRELTACGDGSGGEYSADERYCRCGWGWVLLGDGDEFEQIGAHFGPLPGAR
eukprot:2839008-Pyramimonas_sp.AAC.1